MVARDRYKQRRSNRKTYSFHLSKPSIAQIDELLERGVFENRSHAVDEALLLLLRVYQPVPPTDDRDRVAA